MRLRGVYAFFTFLIFCVAILNFVSAETDLSNLTLIQRSMYSNIYYNQSYNGTNNYSYVAQIFSDPVNYEDNGFYPINTTIVSEECELDYCVNKGVYKVNFANYSNYSQAIKVSYGISYVSFTPVSLHQSSGDSSGNGNVQGYANGSKFIYPNIFGGGLDLEYEYFSSFLKESLIIQSKENITLDLNASSYLISKFKLESKTQLDENTSVNNTIYDVEGEAIWDGSSQINVSGPIAFLDEFNNATFYLPPPYALDSNGSRIKLNYSLEQINEEIYVSILISVDWLQNATYPVAIDPGVEINRGGLGFITGIYRAGNSYYGMYSLITIGAFQGTYDRGWAWFDVSSIDDSATITRTDVEFNVWEAYMASCGASQTISLNYADAGSTYNFNPFGSSQYETVWYYLGSTGSYGSVNIQTAFDLGWKGITLGTTGNALVQSLIYNPSPSKFGVGFVGEEPAGTCWSDLETGGSPKATIYYTLPNSQTGGWPQCDPSQPCCDQNGYFRNNQFICKGPYNSVCDSATSSGCGGHAYVDTCTGSNAECPSNGYQINYPKACDDVSCVSQSCSVSTLQPERTCSAGICQTNEPYFCPNNLKCANSILCKNQAASSSDCRNGYAFDSNNKLCWLDNGATSYNLIYDSNGNLLGGLGLNYSYNKFNQLVNITNNSGSLIAKYYYNDQGIRIKKIEFIGSANTTTYYFDNFVQTVNASGAYNESYYYYYNKLVGRKDNSGVITYYHPDALGSTSLVTNSSGGKVESLDYEPFGEATTDTNQRYTFTGQEQDKESDLLYMKQRYQDPDMAQFIQPDPVIQDIYNPQDLNKYQYARNNPYKYVDESGEYVESIFDVIFISYDIKEFKQNPSFINTLALGGDVLGLILPGVTGVGAGVRGGAKLLSKVDDLSDISKISKEGGKISKIREIELPKEAQNVLSRIKSMSNEQKSKLELFKNREGALPQRSYSDYYRKEVVPTPNVAGRGKQRIVIGQGGETYYTSNHYKSFWRIIWNKIKF